ncbi:MAG: polysaccharide biosynthesis/export protein [Candidatus Eremiobacteraeota bacterium]|jgi:protein involved in polysaccharide export with SLBB domain|nr:polysaccharide biosynthesis/export protein [Candidatus Eremiobacteraeota bacterium]
MMTRHCFRALPAAAALLLALMPLAAPAQEKPQPASTTDPFPAAPPAAAAPSVPGLPAPATVSAVIHPGDQLAISVYGHPELTQNSVVQADGTIQYPLVGRVLVSGLSAAEARDVLAKSLTKYVRHPNIALAVQQQGAINVLVMGNVKNSGRFALRTGSRVSDAIAAGSGVAQVNGEYPVARVSQEGAMTTVSLQKLLHDGDASQNVELLDNAIVYVTGAEMIRVQVLGAVTRPGNVEVNEGDRLSMALARAGAEAQAKPDLNRVYLTRVDPATGKTLPSYEINLYQALQRGDQRYDPILRKDDKIYVPEARQISAGTIGVLGVLGRLLGL